jgi:septal ring factor EnvC (AmiA/AmiB activator)
LIVFFQQAALSSCWKALKQSSHSSCGRASPNTLAGRARESSFVVAARLLLACIALTAANTQAQTDPQNAAQEAQTKQKLEQVRGEIHKITDAQKATNAQKNDAAAALRDQELKVAATARQLRTLDQKLSAQKEKLDQLVAQRDALDAKLKDQRNALAALLRSAYAMGRGEELKLLLAQDRIDSLGRMLVYYRYFEHARVGEIQALLKDLGALAQVQSAIESETAQLKAAHDDRLAEAKQLEGERAERTLVLAALETTLKDQQTRLAALGKDEKGLLELLERLRDIFADIPKQIAGAEPFAQLRGRLIWPVRGKVVTAFGASNEGERESHGVLIATANGSDVHAVSHGRVVFADWLRGFGLLIIVDHGDGYLSLYGYNESLLKDVGDWVNVNEVIATSGASGGRKTAGLYFELRYQGKAIDPKDWLRPF